MDCLVSILSASTESLSKKVSIFVFVFMEGLVSLSKSSSTATSFFRPNAALAGNHQSNLGPRSP